MTDRSGGWTVEDMVAGGCDLFLFSEFFFIRNPSIKSWFGDFFFFQKIVIYEMNNSVIEKA